MVASTNMRHKYKDTSALFSHSYNLRSVTDRSNKICTKSLKLFHKYPRTLKSKLKVASLLVIVFEMAQPASQPPSLVSMSGNSSNQSSNMARKSPIKNNTNQLKQLNTSQSSQASSSRVCIQRNSSIFNQTQRVRSKASRTKLVGALNKRISLTNHHYVCSGCNKVILKDKYLLKACNKYWHENCLKCDRCKCRLGEIGSTLYDKANFILCRQDYIDMFGKTGICSRCDKLISATELVMRAKDNVYHLECFSCQLCNQRFCVGDRFYLCDNKIVCQYDYDEHYAHLLDVNLSEQPIPGDSDNHTNLNLMYDLKIDTKDANSHHLQQQHFSSSLIEAHSFESLKQQSEASDIFLTTSQASQVCGMANEVPTGAASIEKDDSTQTSVADTMSSLSNNHNGQSCASMMDNQIINDLSKPYNLTTQDERASHDRRLEATVVTEIDYNCDSSPDITISSTTKTSTNSNCVTDINSTCEQMNDLTRQNGQLMMPGLTNIGDNQDISEPQRTDDGNEMNEALQNKD